MDILVSQPVLVSIFDEALRGVDHENGLLVVGLVEHNDASRDAGAVEQVSGQSDNAPDYSALNEVLADCPLSIAAEENAMRKDAGSFAVRLERTEDVEQIREVSLLAGGNAIGLKTLPRIVLGVET